MQTSQRPVQWLAITLLLIFTTSGCCQHNQGRRAVTEHQLMHDRGRTIQSLKRLIWLSAAMEGLHTAQTRSSAFGPAEVPDRTLNPALVPAAGGPRTTRVQSLLRTFFNPNLSRLPDEEP